MAIMAIDYGDKSIGIAKTDRLEISISEHETLIRKTLEQDLDYIIGLIEEYSIKTLVMGLPINLDGTSGLIAEKAKEFARLIKEKSKIEVVLQDEKLSSVAAEQILKERKIHHTKWKEHIDQISAAIILQDYIFLKNKRRNKL